jgi:hypothetical protein
MSAVFLGGAQGKVKQKIKISVRYSHTKTKKHSCVGTMCPHPNFASGFDFVFRFALPSSATE